MLLINVKLEKNVKIFHQELVNLYNCKSLMKKISALVGIKKNVNVGIFCKISSRTFICGASFYRR